MNKLWSTRYSSAGCWRTFDIKLLTLPSHISNHHHLAHLAHIYNHHHLADDEGVEDDEGDADDGDDIDADDNLL